MVPSLSAAEHGSPSRSARTSCSATATSRTTSTWTSGRAPEFLEQAAEEVLKEEWESRSWSKLPEGGGLEVEGVRLG